jgi:hypothetical protein
MDSMESPQKKSRGQRGKGKGVRSDHREAVFAVATALVQEPTANMQKLAERAWPHLKPDSRVVASACERVRRILEGLGDCPELAGGLMQPAAEAMQVRKEAEDEAARTRARKKAQTERKRMSTPWGRFLKLNEKRWMKLDKARRAHIGFHLDQADRRGIRMGKWPLSTGSLRRECPRLLRIMRVTASYASATDVQSQLVGQDAEGVEAAQNKSTIVAQANKEWYARVGKQMLAQILQEVK